MICIALCWVKYVPSRTIFALMLSEFLFFKSPATIHVENTTFAATECSGVKPLSCSHFRKVSRSRRGKQELQVSLCPVPRGKKASLMRRLLVRLNLQMLTLTPKLLNHGLEKSVGRLLKAEVSHTARASGFTPFSMRETHTERDCLSSPVFYITVVSLVFSLSCGVIFFTKSVEISFRTSTTSLAACCLLTLCCSGILRWCFLVACVVLYA